MFDFYYSSSRISDFWSISFVSNIRNDFYFIFSKCFSFLFVNFFKFILWTYCHEIFRSRWLSLSILCCWMMKKGVRKKFFKISFQSEFRGSTEKILFESSNKPQFPLPARHFPRISIMQNWTWPSTSLSRQLHLP